jgi:hypothetical protein
MSHEPARGEADDGTPTHVAWRPREGEFDRLLTKSRWDRRRAAWNQRQLWSNRVALASNATILVVVIVIHDTVGLALLIAGAAGVAAQVLTLSRFQLRQLVGLGSSTTTRSQLSE